jgi:hypothetical protein
MSTPEENKEGEFPYKKEEPLRKENNHETVLEGTLLLHFHCI